MEDNKLKVEQLSNNNNIKNVNKTSKNNNSIFKTFFKSGAMQNNEKSLNKLEKLENDSVELNNNKKQSFITKLLKNKQAKVAIIVLIFSVCALLILNSSFGTSSTKTNQTKNESFTSSLNYCEQLETKLKNVLSKINGAGNVSVMVSVKNAPELIIASSSSEKTNTNSTANGSQTNSTISKDPVIVTNSGVSSPLILTEKLPEITGVVVVAEGAKDTKVRLSLLQAVQALLDVKGSNIQIYY